MRTPRRRGVRIYAELIGWGQAGGGPSVAASPPDGGGLRSAMRRALGDAQVVGTGGSVAIVVEAAALARRRGVRIYAELIGWGAGGGRAQRCGPAPRRHPR